MKKQKIKAIITIILLWGVVLFSIIIFKIFKRPDFLGVYFFNLLLSFAGVFGSQYIWKYFNN